MVNTAPPPVCSHQRTRERRVPGGSVSNATALRYGAGQSTQVRATRATRSATSSLLVHHAASA